VKAVAKTFAGLAVVGGIAILLSLFFSYGCIIYLTIGLPCPACGLTRAVFAFFGFGETDNGLRAALAYHPLFWLLPLIPFTMHDKISRKIQNRISVVLIILLVTTYIFRLILLFPHTEPMTINEDALLRVLWRALF